MASVLPAAADFSIHVMASGSRSGLSFDVFMQATPRFTCCAGDRSAACCRYNVRASSNFSLAYSLSALPCISFTFFDCACVMEPMNMKTTDKQVTRYHGNFFLISKQLGDKYNRKV